MMGDEVDEEALKVVEVLQTEQQMAMTDAHRILTAHIMWDDDETKQEGKEEKKDASMEVEETDI